MRQTATDCVRDVNAPAHPDLPSAWAGRDSRPIQVTVIGIHRRPVSYTPIGYDVTDGQRCWHTPQVWFTRTEVEAALAELDYAFDL